MKIVRAIGGVALLLLMGNMLPAYAQHDQRRQSPQPQQQHEQQRAPSPQQPRQQREQQRAPSPQQPQQGRDQQRQAGPPPPQWHEQQLRPGPRPQQGQEQPRQMGRPVQAQPQPPREPQRQPAPRFQAPRSQEQQRGGPPAHEQPRGQPSNPQARSYSPQQRPPQQARAWQRQNGWRQEGAWQGHGTWQEHRASRWEAEHRTWGQRGGYGGYTIPQDRFYRQFGVEHGFRIRARPTIYMGYPRFQYGGFGFMFVDPWPEYWSDSWYVDDDVYVDYDDGYYLYNRRYPGVGIAITVVL